MVQGEFLHPGLDTREQNVLHRGVSPSDLGCEILFPGILRVMNQKIGPFYKLPDLVIVHVGIVDCAPRVFSQFERTVVNHIRPIFARDALVRFVGRHRRFLISHLPQKVYVPLSTFETKYQAIVRELRERGIRLLLVNICPTDTATAFRSPGLSENICLYNQAIARCAQQDGCSLIDIYTVLKSDPEAYLLSGIHLNPAGNKLLADLLINRIQSLPATADKEDL